MRRSGGLAAEATAGVADFFGDFLSVGWGFVTAQPQEARLQMAPMCFPTVELRAVAEDEDQRGRHAVTPPGECTSTAGP